MDERILANFFLGKITERELASNVAGSVTHPAKKVSVVHVRDLDKPFFITRQMAVLLCDAVLEGDVSPALLEPIGFTIVTSDRFEWEEDDLVGKVFHDWACPQINYELTMENVTRFKRWLLNEEPYPEKPASSETEVGNLIGIKHRKSTKYPKLSAATGRTRYKIKPRST
jgi:hypothetical protein